MSNALGIATYGYISEEVTVVTLTEPLSIVVSDDNDLAVSVVESELNVSVED